jgi:hypothetical protein
MECRLAGETEVLGENLPQRNFCPSLTPTWPDPVLNPGRRGGKPTTNRLSYGAASVYALSVYSLLYFFCDFSLYFFPSVGRFYGVKLRRNFSFHQ